MSPGSAAPKLDYRDYLEWPDDGRRHELIGGEHFVSPSPTVRHQRIVLRLSARLALFAENAECGEALGAPVDVVLSPHDVVVPDVVYFANGNEPRESASNVTRPPDLVVEVLSPSTQSRDRGAKRELYQRAGVPEYWVLDPDACEAAIHRLAEGSYGPAVILSAARRETLTTPLLPGWRLDLADLFRRLA